MARETRFSLAGTAIRIFAMVILLVVLLLQAFAPRPVEIPLAVWFLIGSFFIGAEGGEDIALVLRAWRGRDEPE